MAKTYSLGAERIYGWGARLLRWMPVEQALRLVSLFLFCLGIPALYFWANGLFRDRVAALVSGLIYAICLAAVIRSTGQELSRENLGIPLFLGFMACIQFGFRQAGKKQQSYVGLGCVFLAGALISWDLIQFLLGLVLLSWAALVVSSRAYEERPTCWSMGAIGLTMLLCAFFNPYLRAHSFCLSPVMFMALGIWVVLRLRREGDQRWDSPLKCALLFILIVGTGLLIGKLFGSSYGHFFDLLKAKLAFLNVKPQDPSLLNFNQRIMWTPALDSATWALTYNLFPGMLFAGLVAFIVLLAFGIRTSNLPCLILALSFIFLVGMFVLFVRFHVFTIIYAALMVGYALSLVRVRKGFFRWIFYVIIAVSLLWEMQNVLYKPGPRFGRPNTYYESLKGLTQWLDEHADNKPVLANFGVSGSIAAYGNCPIILHPKFETQTIRDRVEGYATTLFKGDEKEFRDWAVQHGAQYYVFSMGEFYPRQKELQLRYMVDALEEGDHTAARQFNKNNPVDLRYFKLVWNDAKYRVFDILTREEEEAAVLYYEMAEQALVNGDVNNAKKRALDALEIDVKHAGALRVLKQSTTLMALGVEYEGPYKRLDE